MAQKDERKNKKLKGCKDYVISIPMSITDYLILVPE